MGTVDQVPCWIQFPGRSQIAEVAGWSSQLYGHQFCANRLWPLGGRMAMGGRCRQTHARERAPCIQRVCVVDKCQEPKMDFPNASRYCSEEYLACLQLPSSFVPMVFCRLETTASAFRKARALSATCLGRSLSSGDLSISRFNRPTPRSRSQTCAHARVHERVFRSARMRVCKRCTRVCACFTYHERI